jgi:hypothetical protein
MNSNKHQVVLFKLIQSIFLICLISVAQARVQNPSQQQTVIQQIKSGETPEGLTGTEWGSIQSQIAAGKYRAYTHDDGGFVSANPAHGWQIRYAEDGTTTLIPRDHTASAYRLGLKLSAIGYQQLNLLGRPQQITAQASTVTYQWNDTLRERWVNSQSDLEQWFILDKRPTGIVNGQPLTLQMTLDSDLKAKLVGNAINFTSPTDTTISYNKLKVWDANGRVLPATMQLAGQTLSLIVEEATARYPLTIDPSIQQSAYLKASNNGPVQVSSRIRFGASVSISGDTVVVGAFNEGSNTTGVNGDQSNNSALGSGAAYVFVRVDDVWYQQAYLKASNTDSSDHFGDSVAIAGDTLVIGATGETSTATGVNGDQSINEPPKSDGFLGLPIPPAIGAAYVFTRNQNTWTQQAYLKASNAETGDLFGGPVSISGDTIVIGASGEDSNAVGVDGDQNNNDTRQSGAAYVFVRTNNSWNQQAYLKASNTDSFDLFARAVSISGDTVVIGAPEEDSSSRGVNGDQSNSVGSFINKDPISDLGAAYVFNRSGTTWAQQAYLKASNSNSNDAFGTSVSISGNTLVIGAPLENSSTVGINGRSNTSTGLESSGAAYVFVRNNSTWSQQAYVKASNTSNGDCFGQSVALFDNMLVIGAPRGASADTGVNGNRGRNAKYFCRGSLQPSIATTGAAYVFTHDGNNWNQQAILNASKTGITNQFGGTVAISRDIVAIGAKGDASNASGINGNQDNNAAPNSGAVHVFDLTVDVVPSPSDSAELFFQNTINFSSSWTAFDIPAIQTTPLIGYGPSSFNGVQPGVIRVRPTDAVNGQWQMRFQEYQYLDQFHLQERTDIIGFTKGVTTLDDGSMIVAGMVTVSGNGIWNTIDFPASFAGVPHVFLFAQSAIGGQPPTIHARNVNASSFEVAIKEEEQLMPSGHVPEDIAYYAIYSPANQGTLMVNNQQVGFSLQQMQVNHQWTAVPGTDWEIKLEEERSLDQEVVHLKETVDVMILGGQLYTQSVTTNGADPFTIRKR